MARPMNMKNKISIVTTTDWTRSAPNTAFIEAAIASLYSNFPELKTAMWHIYYNRHDGNNGERYKRDPNEYLGKPKEEDPYYNNLMKMGKLVCGDNFKVTVFDNYERGKLDYQQAGALSRAIEDVTTPYVIWMQHDMIIKKSFRFTMPQIYKTLETYKHINYIGWNERPNSRKIGQDKYFIDYDSNIKGIDLCQASRYSNHPNIIRWSKMKNEWAPNICANPNILARGGKAANIESSMWNAYRKSGFDRNWGIYLFGTEDEPPTMCHTNARPKGYFPLKYLQHAGVKELVSNKL